MTVRILADDLTGALDSAARFCGLCGPIPVRFAPGGEGASAYDMATRDRPASEAPGRVAAFAADLKAGDPAFHKIDSLLRGHWPLELKVAMAAGFRSCILAPAFPGQGRVTRDGRQWVREAAGGYRPIEPPILDSLARAGIPAARAVAGAAAPGPGIHVFDAADDAGLAAVVATGRRAPAPVLWCGAAGLAGALAGREPPAAADLASPVLAVIGSRAPASLAQVAALHEALPGLRPHALSPQAGPPPDDAGRDAASLLAFDLPAGTGTQAAAGLIAGLLARALPRIARPATLVAAGGETLQAICATLGTGHLRVEGEFAVGIPVSTMVGGRWDGTRVVSKSGAFGAAGLLVRIFEVCGVRVPAGADGWERG